MGLLSLIADVPRVSAATIANGAVSTIVGVDSGLCLGVAGGNAASGAKLQIQSCSGSDFQKWKFRLGAAGYFEIVNAGSNLCIDVTGGSSSNGVGLQQWNCSGADYQKWNLSDQGSGQFAILSKYNGLALDVYNFSVASGSPVVQWSWLGGRNQKWTVPAGSTLPATLPASGSVVTLTGQWSRRCLGIANAGAMNGAKVHTQACDGSPFQQWKVTRDAAGDYAIANVGSGLCLDVPGASTSQGVAIQQWGCGGGAWQKWQLRVASNGNLSLTSKSSGLVLDEDIFSSAGAVIQWPSTGNTNQQWSVGSATNPPLAQTGGPIGFGAGTTGGTGAGSTVVTVDSPDRLAAALCATTSNDGTCTDTTPRVIRISGVLDFRGREGRKTELGCTYSDKSCAVNGKSERILNYAGYCSGRNTYDITYDAASKPLVVGSNKTIIGVGAGSGIKGKGFHLRGGVSNIVIRNLSITDINDGIIWAGDAITIDNASRIWIDHNYLARIGRQQIVSGWGTAQNVTISDNYFDGTTDYGHWCDGRAYWIMLLLGENQTITVSGNRFHNTSGRSPEVGKSSTAASGGIVHMVNNYYDANYFTGGVSGSNDVAVLMEGNYFARGDYYFPIMDTTPGKTNTNSNKNFAPIAGNIAAADSACMSALGRNCTANIDNNARDADFLLNPATLSTIKASSPATQTVRSVKPADASTVPGRAFGPQANIVP